MMQGIGAAGVATVVGKPALAQQEDQTGAQESTAVRFVHAVSDAPDVDVFLEEGGQSGELQDDGTGTEDQTTASSDEPAVEGVAFRDVSSYQEVDPGTYTVRVETIEEAEAVGGQGANATDAGNSTETLQFQEDDGQQDGGTVIFEAEVELAEQTTYTAVAFGELAGTAPSGGTTGGDDATGGGPVGEAGQSENESVDTQPAEQDQAGGRAQPGGANQLVQGLAFGDYEYVELEPGDHTLEFREAGSTTTVGGEIDTGGQQGANTTDDGAGIGEETNITDDGIGQNTTEDGIGTGQAGDTSVQAETSEGSVQVELLEDELTVTGAGMTTTAGDDGGVGDENVTSGQEDETVTIGQEDGNVTTGQEDGNATSAQEETAGTSRVRIFHAAQNVDAVDVVLADGSTSGEMADSDADIGEDTDLGEEETGMENDTDDIGSSEDVGIDDGQTAIQSEGVVQEAEITTEDRFVYSGFAVGNFESGQAAADSGTGTDGDGTGNETGDDGIDINIGNETEDDGIDISTGNETDDGGIDISTGDETDGGTAQAETGDEEFELLFVEDAEDGERLDGGTEAGEDGGIVPSAETATSD